MPASRPLTAQPKPGLRIAILGGDGRLSAKIRKLLPPGACVRRFQSTRCGGVGEARALMRALRAGGVSLVLILARWNGHAATRSVQSLCRLLGIPVRIIR